jgi:hypothetical protein
MSARLMEMTMEHKKPDPDRIAEEAVGEALESRRPDAGKEEARAVPTSAGPQANVADKTAESVGERVGNAYAHATSDEARERSRNVVQQGAMQAGPRRSGAASDRMTAGGQQVVTAVAAFALGYVTAFLFHGRGR